MASLFRVIQIKLAIFFSYWSSRLNPLPKWPFPVVMSLLDLKIRLKPRSQSSTYACKLPKFPFLEQLFMNGTTGVSEKRCGHPWNISRLRITLGLSF